MDVEFKHLSGSKSGAVETVRGLPIRIGRAADCQVRFDDADRKVSGTHAELRKSSQGGIEVFDLDSKNGVLVNGALVDDHVELSDNAVLQLGEGGPRLQVSFDTDGGVSFARVRADTERRTKGEVFNNLTSTEEHLPAYDPDEHGGFDLRGPKSPPSLLKNKPLLLGVVVALICGAVIAVGAWFLRSTG